MTLPEFTYCDCAQCGAVLLADRWREWVRERASQSSKLPPVVCGRINGRPYCGACLRVGNRAPSGGPWKPEPNPSQENAIRCLEDG